MLKVTIEEVETSLGEFPERPGDMVQLISRVLEPTVSRSRYVGSGTIDDPYEPDDL